MMTTARELRCRIVLAAPPSGVAFALQVGHGADFDLAHDQQSTGRDLTFEFSIEVRATDDTGEPDFRGASVQGPRGQRFIYISSGTYAGQPGSRWGRRLKVPLAGITRDTIDRALANPRAVLEARVPGTARDGGPNAATVKPFAGWTLTR